MAWIVSGISSFEVAGRPLQLGVVGLFPGTGCIISRILGRNWWPTVPGVYYPDSAP
jgi:hypothetical protein